MNGAKSLNTGESKNRFRFENFSRRLQRVNVDVVHNVKGEGSLNEISSKAPRIESGTYFHDELERSRELYRGSVFKRFYYACYPLVQSLAELLYHKEAIVNLLLDALTNVLLEEIHCFYQLTSVLARDLQDELFPHYHQLTEVMVKRVPEVAHFNGPNPELTSKLFECISYVSKFLITPLIDHIDEMRRYYGTLLGSNIPFVRKLAAKTFTIATRRLPIKTFKTHFKKVMKNLCKVCSDSLPKDAIELASILPPIEKDKEQQQREKEQVISNNDDSNSDRNKTTAALPRQIEDIMQGLSMFLFYSLKGVKGKMHSKGSERLDAVCEVIHDMYDKAVDRDKQTTSTSNNTSTSASHTAFVCGSVLNGALQLLYRHVRPDEMKSLWAVVACYHLKMTNRINQDFNSNNDIVDSNDRKTKKKEKKNGKTTDTLSVDMLEGHCVVLVQTMLLQNWLCTHGEGRALGLGIKSSSNSSSISSVSLSKPLCVLCVDLCHIANKLHLHSNQVVSVVVTHARGLLVTVWSRFPELLPEIREAASKDECNYTYKTIFEGSSRNQSKGTTCSPTASFVDFETCLHAMLATDSTGSTEDGVSVVAPGALELTENLVDALPMGVLLEHYVKPLFAAFSSSISSSTSTSTSTSTTDTSDISSMYSVCLKVFQKLAEDRQALVLLRKDASHQSHQSNQSKSKSKTKNQLDSAIERLLEKVEWDPSNINTSSSSPPSFINPSNRRYAGMQGKVQTKVRDQYNDDDAGEDDEDVDGFNYGSDLDGDDEVVESDDDKQTDCQMRIDSDSDDDSEGGEERHSDVDLKQQLSDTLIACLSDMTVFVSGCISQAVAATSTAITEKYDKKSKKKSKSPPNMNVEVDVDECGRWRAAICCLAWCLRQTPQVMHAILDKQPALEDQLNQLVSSTEKNLQMMMMNNGSSETSSETNQADLWVKLGLMELVFMYRMYQWRSQSETERKSNAPVDIIRIYRDVLLTLLQPQPIVQTTTDLNPSNSETESSSASSNATSILIMSMLLRLVSESKDMLSTKDFTILFEPTITEDLLNVLGQQLMQSSHYIRRLALVLLLQLPLQIVEETMLPRERKEEEKNKNNIKGDSNDSNIDSDDDSDEDEQQSKLATSQSLSMNLVDACIQCGVVASFSVGIASEREILRRLESIEVTMRSRFYSIEGSKLVISFCLGLLHIKYKPLWAAALKVIQSACKDTVIEKIVWPLVYQKLCWLDNQVESENFSLNKQLQLLMRSGASSATSNHVDSIDIKVAFRSVLLVDDGRKTCPTLIAQSAFFPVQDSLYVSALSELSVEIDGDARTDHQLVYDTLCELFVQQPDLITTHTKQITVKFLYFLQHQYYNTYSDDQDIPELVYNNILIPPNNDTTFTKTNNSITKSGMSAKTARLRLHMFLKTYSHCLNPKGVLHNSVLFRFYSTLVSFPDAAIAKLAFKCLLAYKVKAVVPYAESAYKIFEDKSMRNELVSFDPNTSIEASTRAVFIPLLTRIVFGRLTSRGKGSSGGRRGQVHARRTAALAFLSKLEPVELTYFISMVLRGVVPRSTLIQRVIAEVEGKKIDNKKKQSQDELKLEMESLGVTTFTEYSKIVVNEAMRLHVSTLEGVRYTTLQGFLFVLEQTIKVMGHKLNDYVPALLHVVVIITLRMNAARMEMEQLLNIDSSGDVDADIDADVDADIEVEDEEVEEREEEKVASDVTAKDTQSNVNVSVKRDFQLAARVRTLCLLRMGDMVHQYHDIYKWVTTSKGSVTYSLRESVTPLITRLAVSIHPSTTKTPALLRLLSALSTYHSTSHIIGEEVSIVRGVISCLAKPLRGDTSLTIIRILNDLLSHNEDYVLIHSQYVIECFSRRFLGIGMSESLNGTKENKTGTETGGDQLAGTLSSSKGALSEIQLPSTGSTKLELKLLKAVASALETRKDIEVSPQSVDCLATVLLAMIRNYGLSKRPRIDQYGLCDILDTYKSLCPKLENVTHHIPFISALFGPSHVSTPEDMEGANAGTGAGTGASEGGGLLDSMLVREGLVRVYQALASHSSTHGNLSHSSDALAALIKTDTATVGGGRDYGSCMPVFQTLAAVSTSTTISDRSFTWEYLVGPLSHFSSSFSSSSICSYHEASLQTAVVWEVLRCMGSAEMAVRQAALLALQRLVQEVNRWDADSRSDDNEIENEVDNDHNSWSKILEDLVLPSLRKQLSRSMRDSHIKTAMALLSTVVREATAKDATSTVSIADLKDDVVRLQQQQQYHADLFWFHHIDPEQDLFSNLVHIQVHRRVRAMRQLKGFLEETALTATSHTGENDGNKDKKDTKHKHNTETNDYMDEENKHEAEEEQEQKQEQAGFKLSQFTLVHVIIPLVFHHMTSQDFKKKDHISLIQEAGALLGAICRHLTWSKYHNMLRRLLRLLQRNDIFREKAHIMALCHVLDAFHFNTTVADVDVDTTGSSASGVVSAIDAALAVSAEGASGEANTDGTGEKTEGDDNDDEKEDEEDAEKQEEEQHDNGKVHQQKAEQISQTMLRTIFPWVRVFLLRTDKDRDGNKIKVVRPNIAVALTKLAKNLTARLVNEHQQKGLYMSLVVTVTNTLKSRDVSARDAAREGLAKMLETMGVSSLQGVVYELNHILTEGTYRHTRNYTIRHLLQHLSTRYSPPTNREGGLQVVVKAREHGHSQEGIREGGDDMELQEALNVTSPMAMTLTDKDRQKKDENDVSKILKHKKGKDNKSAKSSSAKSQPQTEADPTTTLVGIDISLPAFDRCLSSIMPSILDDLGGEGSSREDRQAGADGAIRSATREAKGSKANESLELCARMLLFRPTYAIAANLETATNVVEEGNKDQTTSSVHAVVTPLLALIEGSDDASLISRVTEGMARVAIGLAKNPSLLGDELMLYLHATLHPHVDELMRQRHVRLVASGANIAEDTQTKVKVKSKIKAKDKTIAQKMVDAWDDEDEGWEELGDNMPSYLRETYLSDDEDSDVDTTPLKVYTKGGTNMDNSSQGHDSRGKGRKKHDEVTGFKANTWLPFQTQRARDQREAVLRREHVSRSKFLVQDGFSAPKLSGFKRSHDAKSKSVGAYEPAALGAVKFCLLLLQATLKSKVLNGKDEQLKNMASPFLPLLSKCLRFSNNTTETILTIKCLSSLISWEVPLHPTFTKNLASRYLIIMTQGTSGVSSDSELTQECLRGLSLLFKRAMDTSTEINTEIGARVKDSNGSMDIDINVDGFSIRNKNGNKNSKQLSKEKGKEILKQAQPKPPSQLPYTLPLRDDKLRVLLSLLTGSLSDFALKSQNALFQLIKAVMDSRVLLPELYDLVTKLIEQIVLAQKETIRNACSTAAVSFLISYPMGDKRFEAHLKQIIKNASDFEFESGRLTGIQTLEQLIRLVAAEVLESHGYGLTIFLSLALQMGADPSSKCREVAASTIVILMRRLSSSVLKTIYDYCLLWTAAALPQSQTDAVSGTGAIVQTQTKDASRAHGLLRTGTLSASLLVKTRPDLIKTWGATEGMVTVVARGLAHLVPIDQLQALQGNVHTTTGGAESLENSADASLLDSLAGPSVSISTRGLSDGQQERVAWIDIYHLLLLLESLLLNVSNSTDKCICSVAASVSTSTSTSASMELMMHHVSEQLVSKAPWVRVVAVRVLMSYLSRRDATNIKKQLTTFNIDPQYEFMLQMNTLHHLARRLCVCLNSPAVSEQLMQHLQSALVWVMRALGRHPHLVNSNNDIDEDDIDQEGDNNNEDGDEDDDEEGEDKEEDTDNSDTNEATSKTQKMTLNLSFDLPSHLGIQSSSSSDGSSSSLVGLRWILGRLRAIGADHRASRRFNTLKVLQTLIAAEKNNVPFIQAICVVVMEVCVRAINTLTGPDEELLKRTTELAHSVLEDLERSLPAQDYVQVFSAVQDRLTQTKRARQQMMQQQAVTDPKAYAQRKHANTQRKKDARKRKNLIHAAVKGLKRKKN